MIRISTGDPWLPQNWGCTRQHLGAAVHIRRKVVGHFVGSGHKRNRGTLANLLRPPDRVSSSRAVDEGAGKRRIVGAAGYSQGAALPRHEDPAGIGPQKLISPRRRRSSRSEVPRPAAHGVGAGGHQRGQPRRAHSKGWVIPAGQWRHCAISTWPRPRSDHCRDAVQDRPRGSSPRRRPRDSARDRGQRARRGRRIFTAAEQTRARLTLNRRRAPPGHRVRLRVGKEIAPRLTRRRGCGCLVLSPGPDGELPARWRDQHERGAQSAALPANHAVATLRGRGGQNPAVGGRTSPICTSTTVASGRSPPRGPGQAMPEPHTTSSSCRSRMPGPGRQPGRPTRRQRVARSGCLRSSRTSANGIVGFRGVHRRECARGDKTTKCPAPRIAHAQQRRGGRPQDRRRPHSDRRSRCCCPQRPATGRSIR